MSESDDVMIEIYGNTPSTDSNLGAVKAWDGSLKGKEATQRYERQRQIERVPPLLLKGEKGRRNRECYEPAVVSLGPYHHSRTELAMAEDYKLITLEEFRLSCHKAMGYLYNEVVEVVEDARKCYIDGSTDGYNDEEFTRMMLRDGCFVLFFIECISFAKQKKLLSNEHLGALGVANVTRDIFLLENQIPFVVLQVLLQLRFPDDKGEQVLNRFFNYLNYGEVLTGDEEVLGKKQPLHLLELYRSCFISFEASFKSTVYSLWGGGNKIGSDMYGNVQPNGPFASIVELKAKGIFLKRTYNTSSMGDIKLISHCCYGELQLVRRAVSSNTKAIYMNMIAYEMCPHNPNDYRISTYIRVMKSLVIQRDDVRELRKSNILRHSLGSDEEVVKMYDEIEAPEDNLYMLNQLRQGIQKHCDSKFKTWAGELVSLYFSSPWSTLALLVATAILFASFLQTYFTIMPRPDTPKH